MSVRQAPRAPAPARPPQAPAEAATDATGAPVAPVAPLLCPGPHRPLAHVLQAGAAHAAAPTGVCMPGGRCVSITQQGYGRRLPKRTEFSYRAPAKADDLQAFLDVFMPPFETAVIEAFGDKMGNYNGGYVCIANREGKHTEDHRFYLPSGVKRLGDADHKFRVQKTLFFHRIMALHQMDPGAEVPLNYTAAESVPESSDWLRTTTSPADADAYAPMETPTDGRVLNMLTRGVTRGVNKVFGARTTKIDACRMYRLEAFKWPGLEINVNFDFWDQACDIVFPLNGAAPVVDNEYAAEIKKGETLPLPLRTKDDESIIKGVNAAKEAVEKAHTDLKNVAENAYLKVTNIARQNGIENYKKFMANKVYITFDMDFSKFGSALSRLDQGSETKHFHILDKQESEALEFEAEYVEDKSRLNTVFKHLKAMAGKKILLVGYDTDYDKPQQTKE